MHTDWMIAILFDDPPSIELIRKALGPTAERRVCRHDVAVKPDHSLLANRDGLSISVDVYSRPWQDTCGDDQGPTSPNYLVGASETHLLGAPWSLHRAIEQYRQNDGAQRLAEAHHSFVLLRISPGPGGHTAEDFGKLLKCADRLLALAPHTCYFNPRGETLSAASHLHDVCTQFANDRSPPVELIVNARINPLGSGWSIADTVGLAQLGLVDHEVVFTVAQMPADDALGYARKLAMHVIQNHPAIPAGETASGPCGIWEAMPLGQGALAPTRAVIRWLPEDRQGLPKSLELP